MSLLALPPCLSAHTVSVRSAGKDLVDGYLQISDDMYREVGEIAEAMAKNAVPDRSLFGVIEEIQFLNNSTMSEEEYALRNWMLWFYFGWAYGEQLELVSSVTGTSRRKGIGPD